MLIDATHPALEDREIAFNRVGVRLAAYPFLNRMVNGFVAGEPAAWTLVGAPFVRHQRAFSGGIG